MLVHKHCRSEALLRWRMGSSSMRGICRLGQGKMIWCLEGQGHEEEETIASLNGSGIRGLTDQVKLWDFRVLLRAWGRQKVMRG